MPLYIYLPGKAWYATFFVWVLFIILALLNHADVLPLPFIPSDMTLHAFGISGMLTSLLMQKYASPERPGKFIGILCGLGLLMLAAGFASHPFLDYLKDTSHSKLVLLLHGNFSSVIRLLLLLTDIKAKPAGSISNRQEPQPLPAISFHISGMQCNNYLDYTTPPHWAAAYRD